MTTINRSDITKMHFHVWQCPSCKDSNEEFIEGATRGGVICDSCDEEFEVIEGK